MNAEQNEYVFISPQLILTIGSYWLGKLDRIAHPAYIPTVEDILDVKVRTPAIAETNFIFDWLPISYYPTLHYG